MSIPYKTPGDSLSADEWNAIFAAADAILTNYFNGLSPLFFGDAGGPRKFFFFNPVVPPTSGLHPLAATGLAAAKSNLGPGYLRQYNHAAITNLVAGLASVAPASAYTLTAKSLNVGGTLNHVGDILTLVGGTVLTTAATIRVDAIGFGGIITASSIVNAGLYSVAPSSPTTVTGGNSRSSRSFNTTFTASPYNPFGVLKITGPTNAAWHAAIFPENGYGTFDGSYGGTINLDICLSVLTRSGSAVTLGANYLAGSANGFPGYVGNGEVEIVHNYDPIELIICSDLSFDASWNKYSAFRIHNFGAAAATVSFPGAAITVPPGGVKCIRRDNGGGYLANYNYFQTMVAGDPRFFAWGDNSSTQLSPFTAATLLLAAHTSRGIDPTTGLPYPSWSLTSDLSKAWDMSALYTALFAPAAGSSIIFDLLVHFGQIGARSAISFTIVNGGHGNPPTAYGPCQGGAGAGYFQAVFQSTAVGGVIVSAVMTTGGNYTTIPTNPVAFDQYGALFNLTFQPPISFTGWANIAAMFAAAGYTWSYNPTTKQATVTKTGLGQVLVDIGTNLLKFLTGTVHQVNGNFTADLSAASMFTRAQRLLATQSTDGNGVITNSYTGDPTDVATYYVTYTVADTVQKILDCLNALACALVTLQNTQLRITPFGPVLYWEEVYPINKNFGVGQVTHGISCNVQGTNVIVGNVFMLVGSFQNFFLPTTAPLSKIHFPRNGRVYQSLRAILHNGKYEPWQTNAGAYTTNEPPLLKRYFETQPVATEAPLPAAQCQPAVPRPDGASYMGPIDNATVLASAAEVLLCQAEHYNALASQINSIPITPAKMGVSAPGIPTYAPSGVPVPAGSGLGSFWPRTCFYAWMAPASGTDTTAAAMTALGLTIQTGAPDGYGTPLPIHQYVQLANGSVVLQIRAYAQNFDSTFPSTVARYRWITIDDARALYARLNLPFVLNSTLVPMKYQTVTITGGSPTTSSVTGLTTPFPTPDPNDYTVIESPTYTPTDGPGGVLGDYEQILAIFLPDPTGNWACAFSSQPLSNVASLPVWPFGFPTWTVWTGSYHDFSYAFTIRDHRNSDRVDSFNVTTTSVSYTPTFSTPAGFLPRGTAAPTSRLQAISMLAEGVASICVIVQPRNYFNGTAPVNTLEDGAGEVHLVDGSGQLGCETLITCGSANAILITFPVNNTFTPGIGAGSDNVGAGDDSWSAGG